LGRIAFRLTRFTAARAAQICSSALTFGAPRNSAITCAYVERHIVALWPICSASSTIDSRPSWMSSDAKEWRRS
jgi:hypothetical protein